MIDVKRSDRVLLLSRPALQDMKALATMLSEGILVCMIDPDATAELRREMRDYQNLMIVPADPDGVIPWKEEFFSVVWATHFAEPTAEMLRVVIPGGAIHTAGGVLTKR